MSEPTRASMIRAMQEQGLLPGDGDVQKPAHTGPGFDLSGTLASVGLCTARIMTLEKQLPEKHPAFASLRSARVHLETVVKMLGSQWVHSKDK